MIIEKIKQDVQKQQDTLKAVVEQALLEATKGAEAAEVSITKSTGISVSSRLGQTENIEFNSDGVLGITVYNNKKKGSTSTNDLSPQAIKQAVKAALDILRFTSEDPFSGVGDKSMMEFDPPDLDLFYPTDLDVEQAIKRASETEQVALSYPQITGSEGSQYNSNYGIHVYGNTHGMLASYCASRHSLSCCVIGEHNGKMERNYAYTTARDINDFASNEWVGCEAAERTIARLGAKQIQTMQTPVLFSADVALSLFSHFANAISGGTIYRKSSFLLDALGKNIFPDWLTITEMPHILKGLGSAPFDNEGTKTVTRNIIDNGVLQTYLLSNYSARKLNMLTTGHAGGIHNWRISGLGGDFKAMLKQLDRGLLVTSLMGQGVNAITGDYSRGAAGFWVENGEIQYPVNEITIAGNLKNMFKNIVMIGNDIETRSNIQCGSVLLDNMSIAGK